MLLKNNLVSRNMFPRCQYGLRAERCTLNAAIKLRKMALATIKKCQLCAAVSLGIKNAFNSIPRQILIRTSIRSITRHKDACLLAKDYLQLPKLQKY